MTGLSSDDEPGPGIEGGPEAEQDRIVVLGKIAGTFGVLGWVKVSSYTEPANNLLQYPVWRVRRNSEWLALEVSGGRITGKGILAKLTGIDTPEDAKLWVGSELGVWRREMPPTLPNEYYLSDLEGLEVVNASGETLGRIDHFRSTPSSTVVVVRRQGHPEQWVPFVKERIVRIDLPGKCVVLDWPADL
jgi:16S rRNA processing protein RimM